jgi:hypothetical protein
MPTWLASFLTCFILSVLTSACANNMGEYSFDLPNGYRIERYNSREVMIVDRESRVVVAGLVREYAIDRSFVIGRADLPPTSAENQARYYSDVRPGYFVVDTSTGEVSLGLSELEWKTNLVRRNISVRQLLAPP